MKTIGFVLLLGLMLGACARGPAAPELVTLPPAPPPLSEEEVRGLFWTPHDVNLAERMRAEDEAAREADAIVAVAPPRVIDPAFAVLGLDPDDFDLPIHLNEAVLFWKDFFRNRIPDRFTLYLARMGRYEEMISARLRERGMPQDLIFLALIESGFSPHAYSRARAVGVWQFIAPTGRRYGLEVTPVVDERRDPVRATDAALDYLEDLHRQFGSWYLAAAAYNTGENRVERLLQRYADGRRGDDALFWQIAHALPRETRNYVPKLIAATILGRNADSFGLAPASPFPTDAFDVVSVPDATDMAVIAEAAGADKTEIERLNPQFLRGYTPPGRASVVRVPGGRGPSFTQAYALVPPDQRVRFVEHIVRSGETLSHISRRYGISIAEIQSANGIRNPHALSIGRRLVIPRGGAARATRTAAAATAAPTAVNSPGRYTVQAGDTLWDIARRHRVSVRQLREWNNLSNNAVIRPGDQVLVRLDG